MQEQVPDRNSSIENKTAVANQANQSIEIRVSIQILKSLKSIS